MELILTAQRQDAAGQQAEGKRNKRFPAPGAGAASADDDKSEREQQAKGKALRPVRKPDLCNTISRIVSHAVLYFIILESV